MAFFTVHRPAIVKDLWVFWDGWAHLIQVHSFHDIFVILLKVRYIFINMATELAVWTFVVKGRAFVSVLYDLFKLNSCFTTVLAWHTDFVDDFL